jgi:hypothetical protein
MRLKVEVPRPHEGSHMTTGRTILRESRDPGAVAGYTAAVSLHAHTGRSKEGMVHVSRYITRIPLVSILVRRELDAYARRNNECVNFKKAWWHPPVDARTVLQSEASQIAEVLGLTPIVSITDHDTLEAHIDLQSEDPNNAVPISFEWTVPFNEGFFHVGVHNLPRDHAPAIYRALSAYTRDPNPAALSRLLDDLNRNPEVLVVLNHPLWDLANIGPAHHVRLLRRFLTDYGGDIHALELNGYRSWRENTAVRTLAQEFPLPLISGGDRHGCAPNALLNLTTATTFGGFVREIRMQHKSAILVMPAYRTSLVVRKLESATEVMRRYPSYPSGRQRWMDRVCYEENGVAKPLSEDWPDGGPLWVRAAMNTFLLAASWPFRPILRAVIWLAGASRSHQPGPASHIDALRLARRPDAASREPV